MKVVQVDHDIPPDNHGTGYPVAYHEPTNTAYIGQAGGYHHDLIQNTPHGEPGLHLWRLGSDGLLDFYGWGGPSSISPDTKQEAIEALGAEGEHTWKKGDEYDWYFSKVAGLEPPPEPDDKDAYWKAVTIDGQHHVFHGDTKSHLQHVADLGYTAHDVSDFWGWNPYMGKWENFNRFKPDYQSVWDDTKGQDPNWKFDFDGPTFAKTATYTEDELPEGLQPYANGGYGFEKWEPGHYGKGVVIHDPDPRLISWKVPDIFSNQGLHHGDITGLMNSESAAIRPHIPYGNEIWIEPGGEYRNFGGDIHLPATLDPRLKPEDANVDPWRFKAGAVDDYGLSAWGEDFDRGFSERAKNPISDEDILDLLTPEPVPGGPQKGIRLPSGERYFWPVDEFGFPHHKQVLDALDVKGDDLNKTDCYDVDEDGVVRNIFAKDEEWDFSA